MMHKHSNSQTSRYVKGKHAIALKNIHEMILTRYLQVYNSMLYMCVCEPVESVI